jgi:hypothetical protein
VAHDRPPTQRMRRLPHYFQAFSCSNLS